MILVYREGVCGHLEEVPRRSRRHDAGGWQSDLALEIKGLAAQATGL